MSECKFVSNSFDKIPSAETARANALANLALDLRWSWNHAADEVWRALDPALWDLTRNPWAVLQTVSRDQFKKTLDDPVFRARVEEILALKNEAANTPAWFQQHHGQAGLNCVAYFSMEYMLSEALPIYSGGLGNVAGDQLKTASDLGVPVIAVGLLYQQGYFRQVIDKGGFQHALYPYNDPGQLPITPLRKANGEWVRIEIALPGYSVWLRAWQVEVGRLKLYLLDSNDPANIPIHRGITSELYGGGSELRLRQELILGIGGWRLLVALGFKPQVCHLNEGHAAFLVLERARQFMEESGQPFGTALAVTRAGNLFTTHTAVPAGFDRFATDLIEQNLSGYARRLGISIRELLALGQLDGSNSSESFNMAYLAIRGSGAVNGVSRLHGEVSRALFASLFPRWPQLEVPVRYVTNGVHMPSWDSEASDSLWTKACNKNRWLGTTDTLEQDIRRIPEAQLWQLRMTNRKLLVEFARERLGRQLAVADASAEEVESARHIFDPNVLTLGFARRFATYKRPTLLLHDQERFLRLLTNPDRPVQLVIAGKAHPADQAGQAMIQQWVQFIARPEARRRVIFLSDYDMHLTERLVQGVDLWLNTPRRPWEASGTSGMKVLVNGGLNLSELDGWWVEAYSPEVGWALGDGREHGDDPSWDAAEANRLYDLLEREIAPEFYRRGSNGVPSGWVARVRESMARLTPRFSANRTVREYTEELYLSAAAEYERRAANKGERGTKIAAWQNMLEREWPGLRFGEMRTKTIGGKHTFEVQVFLGEIAPDALRVELYADGSNGSAPVRQEMTRGETISGLVNAYLYSTSLPATRPATDYTPRIIPFFAGVTVPLEEDQILWQR